MNEKVLLEIWRDNEGIPVSSPEYTCSSIDAARSWFKKMGSWSEFSIHFHGQRIEATEIMTDYDSYSVLEKIAYYLKNNSNFFKK
jgi:hypothetical protein